MGHVIVTCDILFCLSYPISPANRLPSDFFDSSAKLAVAYSDSESEEDGNGDTSQQPQKDNQPSKDSLTPEQPSQQLPEGSADQER